MNRSRFLVQDANYKSNCSQQHQFVEKAPLCSNKCTAASAEELQLLCSASAICCAATTKHFIVGIKNLWKKKRMNYGSLGNFATQPKYPICNRKSNRTRSNFKKPGSVSDS